MSNLKYILVSILSFIIFAVCQINIFNKLSILNVIPNVCIIYYIYFALISNSRFSTIILSIVTGIVYDICFSNVIGLYMLLVLGITIITPVVCNRFATDTRIGMMLYVFISTFIFETIYGTIYLVTNNASLNIFRFVLIVLISSAYNGILTLFIHSIYSSMIKEKKEMYKIIRKY